jgi:hypothetical protein
MIMTDLAELRRQRADLDQQIVAEELRLREVWNDGLDAIEVAVRDFAESAGQEVTEAQRKNVTSLDLAGLVTVQLGREEGEWGRHLSVSAANGVTATFGMNAVPHPGAVVRLLSELLIAQAPLAEASR